MHTRPQVRFLEYIQQQEKKLSIKLLLHIRNDEFISDECTFSRRLRPRPQVRFLEYIRQWEKKVVFVVNKSDILQGREEVDAVKQFVSANAQRILRLDRPAVIAVGGGRGCGEDLDI